jgi:hypothetical protein
MRDAIGPAVAVGVRRATVTLREARWDEPVIGVTFVDIRQLGSPGL